MIVAASATETSPITRRARTSRWGSLRRPSARREPVVAERAERVRLDALGRRETREGLVGVRIRPERAPHRRAPRVLHAAVRDDEDPRTKGRPRHRRTPRGPAPPGGRSPRRGPRARPRRGSRGIPSRDRRGRGRSPPTPSPLPGARPRGSRQMPPRVTAPAGSARSWSIIAPRGSRLCDARALFSFRGLRGLRGRRGRLHRATRPLRPRRDPPTTARPATSRIHTHGEAAAARADGASGSARNAATQLSAEFQFTVISLVEYDSMSST